MATYTLTISVTDISTVYSQYDKIRVYRSTTGDAADRVLYDTFSLFPTQDTYLWVDSSGDDSYAIWFTYYNSVSTAEGSYSASILYSDSDSPFVPGFSFSDTSYPPEVNIPVVDKYIVDDIRVLIGDFKTVKRDYVSTDCLETYDNVYPDYVSYKLSDPKGWPLKITLDGTEYSNTSNPFVDNYEYLTFSGTQISTISGTLDIWYEKFRFSDREIYKVFSSATPPPPLTSSTTTEYVYELVSAISLLTAELHQLASETSGSFNLQGEISYNPDPVLRARKRDLDDLKKKLEDEVDAVVSTVFEGVRID